MSPNDCRTRDSAIVLGACVCRRANALWYRDSASSNLPRAEAMRARAARTSACSSESCMWGSVYESAVWPRTRPCRDRLARARWWRASRSRSRSSCRGPCRSVSKIDSPTQIAARLEDPCEPDAGQVEPVLLPSLHDGDRLPVPSSAVARSPRASAMSPSAVSGHMLSGSARRRSDTR